MSKETFKQFVRNHPTLVDYVNHNEMTWQKFYEMYDMYGEDHAVWDKYTNSVDVRSTSRSNGAMNDFISMIRGVDLETVQKGVNGLQKAIGLLQEIKPTHDDTTANQYEERPIHKYYED